MDIRGPREQLAGCFHLARLVDKVRHHLTGTLPEEFRRYLFHSKGLDGVFMGYFGLTSGEIVEAVRLPQGDDSRIESWFSHRVGSDQQHKSEWNKLALNLGRQGYPMADSFPRARKVVHNCDDPSIDTCFKLLDWDEGRL